jgi:hypothetical protein
MLSDGTDQVTAAVAAFVVGDAVAPADVGIVAFED